MATKVLTQEIEVDLKKLYIQGNVENNASAWFSLPYELRGCVFLDQNGGCKIYEDRPMVCRTNNVLESNLGCDTRDGKERPVRLLNTQKADIVTVAAFKAAGEGGTLPHLLWKKLRSHFSNIETKSTNKSFQKSKLKHVKRNISKLISL